MQQLFYIQHNYNVLKIPTMFGRNDISNKRTNLYNSVLHAH